METDVPQLSREKEKKKITIREEGKTQWRERKSDSREASHEVKIKVNDEQNSKL